MENSTEVSQKIKTRTIYHMTQLFHFCVLNWRQVKTLIWKKCMHSCSLQGCFIIAKLWKQPRCPSRNRIKKMRCMCTMRYYADKKGDILLSVTTWIKLEGTMLSEISQTEKWQVLLIWNIKNRKQVNKTIFKKDHSHRGRQYISGYQRGREWREGKTGKGVNYMVTDRN